MRNHDFDDRLYQALQMARVADILLEELLAEQRDVIRAYRGQCMFGRMVEYADCAEFAVSRVRDMVAELKALYDESTAQPESEVATD